MTLETFGIGYPRDIYLILLKGIFTTKSYTKPIESIHTHTQTPTYIYAHDNKEILNVS